MDVSKFKNGRVRFGNSRMKRLKSFNIQCKKKENDINVCHSDLCVCACTMCACACVCLSVYVRIVLASFWNAIPRGANSFFLEFDLKGSKSFPVIKSLFHIPRKTWCVGFWLCWGLTTRQLLWVILCRLTEKGRKEMEEVVEEMKKRDWEERGKWKKRIRRNDIISPSTLTCCKDNRPCPTVSQYQLDALDMS